MQRRNRWMVIVGTLIIAGVLLAACGQASSATAGKIAPAKVEKIEGTELNRVVLTEKAAQRLAIQMAPVREEQVNGAARKIIPYAAVIYDLQGKTWLYTSPEALTFVRQAISVDYIEGDNVVLTDGPAAGTAVVTVGVAELYGTDTGIGK
jgi:hypothetical protein